MRKITMLMIKLVLCCYATSTLAGQIAIVIDDLGYHKDDMHAVQLPGQISIAILPHTPYAKRIAERASAVGKEVLLHMPMASLSGKALGPGALEADMDEIQVQNTLLLALQDIPQAVGINNHMGSLGTQMPSLMKPTMAFLQQNQMYFLDSKTTRFSIGLEYASQHGVPYFSRQIFLDNSVEEASLRRQLQALIRIAKQHKQAIGIAHPYPETLAFLKKMLPSLSKQGVELVSLSQLRSRAPLQIAKTNNAANNSTE